MVYKALDLLDYLKVDADGLNTLWAAALKVKLGGGFYAGRIGKGEIILLECLHFHSFVNREGRIPTSIHIQRLFYDLAQRFREAGCLYLLLCSGI